MLALGRSREVEPDVDISNRSAGEVIAALAEPISLEPFGALEANSRRPSPQSPPCATDLYLKLSLSVYTRFILPIILASKLAARPTGTNNIFIHL